MKRKVIITLLALMMCASAASATTINLATAGAQGTFAGQNTLFVQGEHDPTGTGVYGTFLRLKKTGTEEGFNTSASGVLDNFSDTWTADLRADALATVTMGGYNYREFRLDIDEKNNDGGLLTLTELKIYQKANGGISTLAELQASPNHIVYDMGAGNSVLLSAEVNRGGSGIDDLSVFVRDELFTTSADLPYLYLYSKFTGADAGFEEWSVGRAAAPVPEPSTFLLLAVGAGAVGFLKRRRC